MKDYFQYVYDNYLQSIFQRIHINKQHIVYSLFFLTVIIGLGFYMPLFFVPIILKSLELTLTAFIALLLIVVIASIAFLVYRTVSEYNESKYETNRFTSDDDEEDDE